MANLLITGSSGGIGRHLIRRLSNAHEIIPVSRRARSSTSGSGPPDGHHLECDLVRDVPRWPATSTEGDGGEGADVDWIIHLATTYRVDSDLAMVDNLCTFARENGVENLLFVSSWVVHFPQRLIPASYIRMKRACEERVLASGLSNVRIVRPSVVLGEGLSWTRILRRLAPVWWLIPPAFSRSFISIEALCRCIEDMIDGRTNARVVTLLGERSPLAEKARESGEIDSTAGLFGGRATQWAVAMALLLLTATLVTATSLGFSLAGSLGICAAAIAALRYALPWVVSALSDYFAGFVVRGFEPDNVQDAVALCHRQNDNIQVRGYDNARLYFRRPISPRHTTITLKKLDRVDDLNIQQERIRVQAGAHFGALLPYLDAHGLWLENYPNYHFISVGACIASSVHGSNLDKPFLADLVESVIFYDRETDRITTVDKHQTGFADLIFPAGAALRRIVLAVELRVCSRRYYELKTTLIPVSALDVREIGRPSRAVQHYEIRINSPRSRNARLQSYRQVGADGSITARSARDAGLLEIKADSIGRKWNLLQRNLATSLVTSAFSRLFINYEWFFSPDAFAEFWEEIVRDRSRYPLYKLLVRYNRSSPDLETPFHGTVSIDITIFNTSGMLSLSSDLYRRYRPLEHLGKFSIQRHIQGAA